MKNLAPPAGMFAAKRKGEAVFRHPPKKRLRLPPCTVIGVPTCAVGLALSIWD